MTLHFGNIDLTVEESLMGGLGHVLAVAISSQLSSLVFVIMVLPFRLILPPTLPETESPQILHLHIASLKKIL